MELLEEGALSIDTEGVMERMSFQDTFKAHTIFVRDKNCPEPDTQGFVSVLSGDGEMAA